MKDFIFQSVKAGIMPLQKFLLSFCLFLMVGCDHINRIPYNFHTVQKGELYRSHQPRKGFLKYVIKRYGIRTVINLRGKHPEKRWFRKEKKVTDRKGVKLINIAMDADKYPSKKNLKKLLDAYQWAPRPILIHCMSGADRTGEAAAIFVYDEMGQSTKKALKQLSKKYFHFTELHPNKRKFIREYQGREWAYEHYRPLD